MSDIRNVDSIQMRLLEEVADLHQVPAGAYNIRANGQMAGRGSSANIQIMSKKEGEGIDIHIKDGTRHESVHIPVVLSESGVSEMVYNDFYIGDDADVVIVAGCGIHNGGIRIPSMTAFTVFLWERTPRSNMWRSITVPATAEASGL